MIKLQNDENPKRPFNELFENFDTSLRNAGIQDRSLPKLSVDEQISSVEITRANRA